MTICLNKKLPCLRFSFGIALNLARNCLALIICLLALHRAPQANAEVVLADVIQGDAENEIDNTEEGLAVKISQLESIVSEQLRNELVVTVGNWLESAAIKTSPGAFEVSVDPLIELISEPRIRRVVVDINFTDSISDAAVAGITNEVSDVLEARGYVARSSSSTNQGDRPSAYVEVNAPRLASVVASAVTNTDSAVTAHAAADVIGPDASSQVSGVMTDNASKNSPTVVSEASDQTYISKSLFKALYNTRSILVGTTAFILAAIIVLFAFVLRQIRTANSSLIVQPSTFRSPQVDYDVVRGSLVDGNAVPLPRPVNALLEIERESIERGKNLKLSESLAHMNFEQALSFLGKLDRIRRHAVLARLPVHQSIKVRLLKALEHQQLVEQG